MIIRKKIITLKEFYKFIILIGFYSYLYSNQHFKSNLQIFLFDFSFNQIYFKKMTEF